MTKARFHEYQAMRAELEKTKITLAERKHIERAKGLLMRSKNMDDPTAYRAMQKMAMDRNMRLVDLAHSVITATRLEIEFWQLGLDAAGPGREASLAHSFITATRLEIDFWQMGRRLSEEGLIAPLATVGVVGQVTESSVVYDAETTYGGSGGPVLNLDGRVLAVNAAILEFLGRHRQGQTSP